MTRLCRGSILLFALAAFGAGVPTTAAEPAAKSGAALGTFSAGGKSAKLAFAATFTDQKDDRKPTVLVLSDKEVPSSTFKDGSDFSAWRREHKIIGLAFWLDAKNEIYRTDFYDGTSFPTSASGLFDVKVTRAAGSLSGTAKSNQAAAKLHDPVALDATFNALLK
jgi:hypothetical protein